MFRVYKIHWTGSLGQVKREKYHSPAAVSWGWEQGGSGHLFTTLAVCSSVYRMILLNTLNVYIFLSVDLFNEN